MGKRHPQNGQHREHDDGNVDGDGGRTTTRVTISTCMVGKGGRVRQGAFVATMQPA